MENELENEAREITKTLESKVRFSAEWMKYMQEVVEPWTKKNNRPLYYTYCED